MLKTEVNTFIGKKGNPVYNGIKKSTDFLKIRKTF